MYGRGMIVKERGGEKDETKLLRRVRWKRRSKSRVMWRDEGGKETCKTP